MVDLAEYKTLSERCRFMLSVIDHITRFVILIPIKNKEATTVVNTLVGRVFFGVWGTGNFAFRPRKRI